MIDQMRYPSNFAFSSSSGNPNDFVVGGETIHHGNRSRLDSGTSGSSESSKGSGKPPRRRSHRPRGCRGGSNRRRNNADGAKKPNNNNKGRDAKTINNTGNKAALSKHPNHNKQMIPDKNNGISTQEYTILSREDCQQGLRQRAVSASSSVSTSTAQMTDYSSSNESFENQMFFRDFSEIEPSFSDSSSEFGLHTSDSYSSIGSTGNLTNNNQILPPLPSNSFQNEYIPCGPNPYALKPATYDNTNNMVFSRENLPHFHEPSHYMMTTATKFAGGYATPMKNLNPTHLHHNSYPLQSYSDNIENGIIHMKDRNTHPAMGPPVARTKLLSSGMANHTNYNNSNNNNNNSCSSGITVTCSRENNYRAERLEIQRQTVEGGSLFVTSPRSFLMGKRNGNGIATTAF
jgi:hypothetical protein